MRNTKETIATTNSSIQQLERDISRMRSAAPSQAPRDSEQQQQSSSIDTHPLLASQSCLKPPPPITEEQQLNSIDAHSLPSSPQLSSTVTEPVSDGEEEQRTNTGDRQPSPVSMEFASNTENESGASDIPTRNSSDLLRSEHNYCSFESSSPRKEDTPTETMELQVPASPSISSIVNAATSEGGPSLSQEQTGSGVIVEQEIVEVPQVLVYDSAVQEPEVDISPSRHTFSLMPKKTFKKRMEPSPSPKEKPSARKRRRRKRRVSTQGKAPSATCKRRPKDIQLLQRQSSLPASLDMQSPLGSALSRAINTALCPALSLIVSPDGYSSLTRSFQLPEVIAPSRPTHSSSVPGTPSVASSTTPAPQNGFSSGNRVPEILSDLVTSLNTETLTSPPSRSTSIARTSQQGIDDDDGVNSGGNNRVTGILSDLVTSLNTETMIQAGISSPPPVSSEQTFPSDSRVTGIVNNLVTYLTSETIQNAPISADSANRVNAVSAVSRQQEGVDIEVTMQQLTMEVEVRASPLSPLPTDSEVNAVTSGCEASEEYESEEEMSEKREIIDADSLFHPGSNFLFTLGPEEPPLFILPRLACAGDFPLEVDPAAISSVALDMARQGLIHAPHSSDLSSDVTESELTELSELSGVGGGYVVAGADERVLSEVSTARGKTPVISSGSRDSEEQRDSTPTLEELRQSTATEKHAQSLLTGQALSSEDAVPKAGGSAAVTKTAAEDSQQREKVKRSSSSVPTKSVVPASQALKPASAKTQKSSKPGKQQPATVTVATGSKVKKGEGVSVGGAKERSSSMGKGSDSDGSKQDVQMQLKLHMARLEKLKGHLASKKSTPQTTSASETSTVSNKMTTASNSQPPISKSGKASSVSKSTAGAKSVAAKPTEKATGPSKSQQSAAKSVTGKTASTKKAQATSKSGDGAVGKSSTAAAKIVQKQGASSSSPLTPSESTAASKSSLAPKPTEKQAVAGTSKDGKSADDEEETTCARTMGYVRKTKTAPLKGDKGKDSCAKSSSTSAAKVAGTSGAAKKGAKLTVEAALSEIKKIVGARKAKFGSGGASESTSDVQTMSDDLNQLWQSNQETLLERVPCLLPAMPSTISFLPSHRFTMSRSPPAISEKFVAGIEKLDKPKKQMTLSLHRSGGAAPLPTHRHTTYHPYSSPLLMFQSYRLNPLYRTNEKLALHSLSHSNKIDPNRIMCRFELGGICNDPACAGQHFKDIALDKEELIQDLVCYAPQLAGCSVPEAESEGLAEKPQPQGAEVKEKVVSYASQMVERYKKKVSDEDLFKLTVHDVNKERAKLRTDPRAKASYISFDDRDWLTSKEDDLNSLSITHPLSLLASEPRGEVATLEGEGERGGGESEMEWDSISKELMPLGKQRDLPRYTYMYLTLCISLYIYIHYRW